MLSYFFRINYAYDDRYLPEVNGRYDGTSRFKKGHRWGFFPSVSAGWRISEENFFESAKSVVSNLKIRASYGELGNQGYQWLLSLRFLHRQCNELRILVRQRVGVRCCTNTVGERSHHLGKVETN
ncbi:TonB-dependent receptor [Bacteroides salyersiae]|nr:TonB-dependent receptor [Bacteroides salyersiae]